MDQHNNVRADFSVVFQMDEIAMHFEKTVVWNLCHPYLMDGSYLLRHEASERHCSMIIMRWKGVIMM